MNIALSFEVIGKVKSPVQTRAGLRVDYSVMLRPFQRVENDGKEYVGDEVRIPVSGPVFDLFSIGQDLKVAV